MGVAEWFQEFCRNLTVTYSPTISVRYKLITKRLNMDFWTNTSESYHSLYVGSYGRNTAIQGFSDVDMVMELPYATYQRFNNYMGNGQSALLQTVKTSIERTYPTTNIKADGQVISVPFTDGITSEIVPVFVNNNGSYTFPNANAGGSWRTTNPRAEIQAIRDRNVMCNYNLGRVDKLSEEDSPDTVRCDSKLTSVKEVSLGPGSVERRRMGLLRAFCH